MDFRFLICLSVVLACSCESGDDQHGPISTIREVKPSKQVVMDKLRRPWSMAFISEHLAVLAEKDGDLLLINLADSSRQPIQGMPSDLADSLRIEMGLYPDGTYPRDADGILTKYNAGIFDVVLDPDFNWNNWIYLSYASQQGDKFATKVVRAKFDGDVLTNLEHILTAEPYSHGLFHFGGGLTFGRDGKLYITIGERLFGDALQPPLPIAQNVKDPRGKIYRINSDGSVPNDNPDFGADAVPGLFAIGIRAAQGLTVDPRNGNIWFSEHGTLQGDELNLLQSGANYGWPIRSTGGYRGGYVPPDLPGDYTDPAWSWYKTIAPTGLNFYTGDEFPMWQNNLIVPGLKFGNLWRFVIEGKEIISVEELFVNDRVRARKAIVSPDGELYILTDEANGKIIKIENAITKS